MRGSTVTMTGRGGKNSRQSALPYRIPGPAGFGFGQTHPSVDATPSQVAAAEQDVNAERARPFDTSAWHALLRAYNLRPYGTELLHSSVALFKSAARRQVSVKTRLAVRVEKLSFVGKDGSVTLADPTGSVAGTVHAEVFADRKCGVEEGSVLLLKNVAAQYYPERVQKGFHVDENEALHLSVQKANIERVFVEHDDQPDLPRKQGVMPYTENALHPPKVSRQTIRRQRGGAVQRAPSRPQHSNVGRPHSASMLRPQSANLGRPQMSPPGRNYGPGLQGRPQGNGPHRPPVHRAGLQAPRTPLQRGNFNVPSQPHPNRELNKRPGTRPLQSPRPVQRPRYQTIAPNETRVQNVFNSVPQGAPVQNCRADTLTDDQLDDLLGNVDIEAAIAAATQSSSPPGKENASQPVNTQRLPAPVSVPSSTTPVIVPVEPVSSASRAPATQSIPPASVANCPPASANANAVSLAATAGPSNIPAAHSNAATQPARQSTSAAGIGGIDDSMLDSLLDGLDSTDFS